MRLANAPIACLAIALGLTTTAHAQKKVPNGVPILLLSGGQREHHGYREQAFYLARELEDTGRFRVTLAEDASILESPALGKFAAIVAHVDRRDPEFRYTPAQQSALLAYVKAGHGYVSIHGADNAAADWPDEWRTMLGATFSHNTKEGTWPDSKTAKGTFSIKIVDPNHPIAKGLADFTIADELYYKLQILPDVRPIATTEHAGGTWPVAWARTYGDGRVFHTPLGHVDFKAGSPDPLRTPDLLKLVIQGTDWAVEGVKLNPSQAAASR